jgi:hypothetical protein
LYNKFLGQPLGELGFTLASHTKHLPTVLNCKEVGKIYLLIPNRASD